MAVRFHPSLDPLLTDIGEVRPHPDNARNGDVDAIAESMRQNGVYRPIIAQRSTGYVLAGNHQYAALMSMGSAKAAVVFVDVDKDEARRIMLADNRTADLGGYDDGLLLRILAETAQTDAGLLGTGYTDDDLDSLLARVNDPLHDIDRDAEVEAGKAAKPKRRSVPLDLIFSLTPGSPEANLGLRLGWQLGCISTNASTARRYYQQNPRAPRLTFMDNEWHGYDHAAHLAAVAEFRPRYATVRDFVTKEQAAEFDVEWYSVDDTLAMAESLAPHVDNVILIPKFDCLDRLPRTIGGARVVLGYSVQSSYGGTPLPLEAFRGWPVHLLGGSWTRQRAYLNLLGDDVVSLDNNHFYNISRYANVCLGDGTTTSLASVMGKDTVANGMLPALMLSMWNIAEAVRDEYGTPVDPIPTGHDSTDQPTEQEPTHE